MIYIGIDPGASGGIAFLEDERDPVAIKLPETERALLELLRSGIVDGAIEGQKRKPARAVLEKVWASPQMGTVSAFKFGRNVGLIMMALAAVRIPYLEVTPQKWQSEMGCLQPKRPKGTPNPIGSKDKRINRDRAQRLFPSIEVTHATADALLIAAYCRRVERGQLQQPAKGATRGKDGETEASAG